jgi:hypothetical protein
MGAVGSEGQAWGLSNQRSIAFLFSATLFTSALLMFSVQPMFAKMALPRLGGSAAVWSVALVFFQAVLLAGYAYAHLLVRYASLRRGALIHAAVLLLALTSLPVGISERWQVPPESGQAFWLIGLFAASVGAPFFAISATAPLLQAWYAQAGQARSRDPYFLYAASNAGSFLALLAYPFLIEPLAGLKPQTIAWSIAYVLLALLIGLCAVIAGRGASTTGSGPETLTPTASLPWSLRLTWLVLALVPSGLLVSITAFITTDLVSAPFIWVVPLALYLLTFVIAFQSRPLIPHEAIIERIVIYGLPLSILSVVPIFTIALLPICLGLAFVIMLACHGELARLRPPPEHLTEFYLVVSLGGVLGGILAGLVAPNVFSSVLEYPLLISAAFLAVGLSRRETAKVPQRLWLAAVASAVLIVFAAAENLAGTDYTMASLLLWMAIIIVAGFFLRRQPLAVGLLTLAIPVSHAIGFATAPPLLQSRSFYGVVGVELSEDGQFHTLVHGTTMHGTQQISDDAGQPITGRPESQAYYFSSGPFGSAIRHLRAARGGSIDAALVGLGAGSLLCLSSPGESWTFYEIDPEVVRIASDPNYFTFLGQCGPPAGIVLGDGRLMLEREPSARFDLIVLDAFSSDAIPAHLLTTEALGIYLDKLKPGGLALFHVSNRHMELSSVVEAAARQRGLDVWRNLTERNIWTPDVSRRDVVPFVVAVGKTPGSLAGFDADPAWVRARVDNAVPPWTDDFSNVLTAIWRHYQD